MNPQDSPPQDEIDALLGTLVADEKPAARPHVELPPLALYLGRSTETASTAPASSWIAVGGMVEVHQVLGQLRAWFPTANLVHRQIIDPLTPADTDGVDLAVRVGYARSRYYGTLLFFDSLWRIDDLASYERHLRALAKQLAITLGCTTFCDGSTLGRPHELLVWSDLGEPMLASHGDLASNGDLGEPRAIEMPPLASLVFA